MFLHFSILLLISAYPARADHFSKNAKTINNRSFIDIYH